MGKQTPQSAVWVLVQVNIADVVAGTSSQFYMPRTLETVLVQFIERKSILGLIYESLCFFLFNMTLNEPLKSDVL